MTFGWRTVTGGFLAAVLAVSHGADAQTATKRAATVGDETITLEEVEAGARAQLAKIEEQRYAILEQQLDQLIGDRLLAQEAKKRGISVDDLLKAEVYSKAPEVPDAEIAAFIEQNKSRMPQGDPSELRFRVWDYLRSQKVAQQRQAYVAGLRARAKVTTYLEEPQTARVAMKDARGFVRGTKDAPVTIVEFSDFQCPFCKNATATLKQLLDRYPGKVKWVFRDYPLVSIHPAAPKAHEAARCAAEQNKFWEYHDVLFERSPRLAPTDLKEYAKELKLEPTAFARCLDSGKYTAEVNRDVQEGTSLGITGTPTFYINGRQLVGAQPLSAFQRVIEAELAKASN